MSKISNYKNKFDIEKEFKSILHDKEHGASYLASKLGKIILNSGLDQKQTDEVLSKLNILLRLLKKEHPALILLHNLVIELINGIEKKGPSKIPELINAFFLKEEKTVSIASDFLNHLSFSQVITFSHSSTLLKTFYNLKHNPIFFVLESNPGGEGVFMFRELEKKGYEAHLIPDLTFSLFINKETVVVTGFDQLSPKFFVNKVGTKPLIITSKMLGESTIIIGSSNKFTPEIVLPDKKTDFKGVQLSFFEKVELEYVDVIITDKGAVSKRKK